MSTPRQSPWNPLLAAVLFGFALIPTALTAQVRVTGVVRDSASGSPVARVEIAVEGAAATVIATTGSDGRFTLALPAGSHTLQFRRVGYRPLTTPITVSESGPSALELTMVTSAQQIAPVATEAPRTSAWPPGLADRMRTSDGVFITDSVIQQSDHSTLPALLSAGRTGVRFQRVSGRNAAIGRREGDVRGRCYMAIWMNGVMIYAPDQETNIPHSQRQNPLEMRPVWPPDLDGILLSSLAAIEVYNAAQLPSQYKPTGVSCGAILLWTKSPA